MSEVHKEHGAPPLQKIDEEVQELCLVKEVYGCNIN